MILITLILILILIPVSFVLMSAFGASAKKAALRREMDAVRDRLRAVESDMKRIRSGSKAACREVVL